MKHNYIIVDDNHESILNTQAMAMRFQNLSFVGYANNYDDALNLILEHQPGLIFLEINPSNKDSNLSLNLINELYRYLTVIPKIIVTSKDQSLVFRAMEYGVADYLVKPLDLNAFRKAIFKFDKSVAQTTVPAPVIMQQTVPQQAFTFSDFLRQEPIKQPVAEEKEAIVTDKEETIIKDKEKANDRVESEIEDEKITPKTSEVHEVENTAEETIETDSITVVDAESVSHKEETVTEVSENEIVPSEESEIQETTETTTEENTTETVDESEPTVTEEKVEDETITLLPGQKVIVEQEQPLIICVKSYGDYRYIDSRDILYLEADNNSTDIHLKDGEMVTAFKTLKVFDTVLPEDQFLRIHNSYIININQVARIHTGNSLCYIKNSTIKLPFSKSYKENVELIIHRIASGNYLEF